MDILKQRVYNLFAGQSVVDSWGCENLVGFKNFRLKQCKNSEWTVG